MIRIIFNCSREFFDSLTKQQRVLFGAAAKMAVSEVVQDDQDLAEVRWLIPDDSLDADPCCIDVLYPINYTDFNQTDANEEERQLVLNAFNKAIAAKIEENLKTAEPQVQELLALLRSGKAPMVWVRPQWDASYFKLVL